MPYPILDVFDNQITKALANDEIQFGMSRAGFSGDQLRELVLIRRDELIIEVAGTINEYESLESTMKNLQKRNQKIFNAYQKIVLNNFSKGTLLIGVEIILSLFLVLEPVISGFKYFGSISGLYALSNYIWVKIIIGIISSIVLFLFFEVFIRGLIRHQTYRYYRRLILSDISIIDDFYRHKIRLGRLFNNIEENIREKSIKELMRRLINNQINLSYATQLEHISASGLSEVMSAANTINTDAKEKLQFLLNSMPGGSIGIAGSRGAGKSTLIQTYCSRERTELYIKKRKAIAVITSAPVKYDARDFILYLFKSTCISVLHEEAGDDFADFEKFTSENAIDNELVSNRKTVSFLMKVLPKIAVFLIFLGCIGLIFEPAKMYSDSRQSSVQTSKINMNRFDPAQLWQAIIPTKDTGGKLFDIGVLLSFTLLLISFTNRTTGSVFFFSRAQQERIRKQNNFSKKQAFLKETLDGKPNLQIAISWLKKIKFQQSFTTGWSGTLKLPLALEGGVNKAMTFAEKQMSYPEIISAFREYLKDLKNSYPIIIGIDELDKLDSDETAQSFLNEMKSIFGIEGCFFLISVSENAMSNFERRGLPFRDVFDSSFDSIVYLEHFTLNDTIALLQRRVIGNPLPFFCLAFCLAGGLPRDIIRYFREIVRISTIERSIQKITEFMVTDDVVAKVRAIIHSIKRLPQTEDVTIVIACLLDLGDDAQTANSFKSAIQILSSISRDLYLKIGTLRTASGAETHQTEIAELSRLIQYVNETRAYLGYMTTLIDLFATNVNQRKIQKILKENIVDLMAKARQALSIDHTYALTKINACREKEHLAVLT